MRKRRSLAIAVALIVGSVLFLPRVAGLNAADSVHLTAAGDLGATTAAAATLSTVSQLRPSAFMVLGDLSYSSTPETQWCQFVKDRVGEGFPVQLLAGNHESNGLNGEINNFSSCLPNQIPGVVGTYGREYYYDMPTATPVVRVVNASAGLTFPDGTWAYTKGDAHYQWVSDAIDGARAAGIPWVVVNNHFPCLGVSTYGCVMPKEFFDLLLSKKVDLVLTGHDHVYSRTHQLSAGVPGCTALTPGTYNDSCVVDSDSAFTAGAGTVFATVGTGGITLRDINAADAEYPYFAAASGANANPTHGVLDMTVTTGEIAATFVRSTGGNFTDAFRIEKQATSPSPSQSLTSPPPTEVTVNPSADTYVHALLPDKNYGSSTSLSSDGSPDIVSFVRFPLPEAPAGKSLTSAQLVVQTTGTSSAASSSTHSVRLASDSWQESTLTYRNSPATNGIVVGRLESPNQMNTAYTVTLDNQRLAPLLGSSLNLNINSTGDDSLLLWSRNAAGNRPHLKLTFE